MFTMLTTIGTTLPKFGNSDVPESEFLRDIKEIIFSDESHIWFCVRETYFEFEWQRTISDIQNIEQISPELKAELFRFKEGLVESPKVRELKQAIVDLLALFTNDDILNPVNCLIMERYFPPSNPVYPANRLVPELIHSLSRPCSL